MARGNGLMSFLRHEYARRQSGKGVRFSKTITGMLAGCDKGTPYKLPEAQDKMFRGIANKECFRCKGSGVSGWKQQGTVGIVCRCVQQRLPAMQAALEEQQRKLEAELAAAKTETTNETNGTPPEGGPATVAEGEAGKEG